MVRGKLGELKFRAQGLWMERWKRKRVSGLGGNDERVILELREGERRNLGSHQHRRAVVKEGRDDGVCGGKAQREYLLDRLRLQWWA